MRRYTILLVEDDERLRLTIEDYLSINNHKVFTAGDGAEALRIFKEMQSEIQIVVLDGMLPRVDGFDVLRTIRTMSSVPVIMLSARESEADGFYWTGKKLKQRQRNMKFFFI